jgi:hypothetical protein
VVAATVRRVGSDYDGQVLGTRKSETWVLAAIIGCRLRLVAELAVVVEASLHGAMRSSITNKVIYFIPSHDRDSSIRSIQFLDFATNHTKRVANFGKPFDAGLALSPDGGWILYSQVEQVGSELRLVENFH